MRLHLVTLRVRIASAVLRWGCAAVGAVASWIAPTELKLEVDATLEDR